MSEVLSQQSAVPAGHCYTSPHLHFLCVHQSHCGWPIPNLALSVQLFRNGLRNMTKDSRYRLGLKIPQISIRARVEHVWDVLGKQIRSMEAPPCNLGLIYIANVYHRTPSKVLWCLCLDGSELFWWQEGDLHTIRQVVLML